MAIVKSPNSHYTGVSASVSFINGVGECSDPALLQWFKDHGYEVEDSHPDKAEKLIEDMTVPELKEYATAKIIDLGDATKKEDILMAIKAADGGGDGK